MKTRIGIILLVLLLVSFYVLLNLVLPGRIDGSLLAYAVRPASWLIVFGAAAVLFARRRDVWLLPDARVAVTALGLAAFHLIVWFGAGFFTGIGRSPYDFSVAGIARNVLFVGSALVGVEFARGYMIGSAGKKRFTLGLVGTATLFTLLRVVPSTFSRLEGPAEVVAFLGSRGLPYFAEELLTSLIALLGGVPAALAYRGTLEALRWFSPILPDLPWQLTSLIGVLVPVVGMLVLGWLNRERLPGYEEEEAARNESSQRRRGTPLWWGGFAVISVLLIWFSMGILGPRPLLVASGSMRPAMDVGDVVVVSEVAPNDIEVDDVVAFTTRQGTTTIHRVVETTGEGDDCLLTTKGDDNREPDSEPVAADQIRGRVVLVVPKIGWVAIWVKNGIASIT